jgi:hypothetical protein
LGPLFVGMGQMYAWATPAFLLWSMSLGQIVLYWNLGCDAKYGKPEGTPSLKNMTPDELVKLRAELRETYGDIGG